MFEQIDIAIIPQTAPIFDGHNFRFTLSSGEWREQFGAFGNSRIPYKFPMEWGASWSYESSFPTIQELLPSRHFQAAEKADAKFKEAEKKCEAQSTLAGW